MATKYKYNEKRKEWYTLVYDGTFTESGEKHRKRISSKKSSRDLENKVAAFKAGLVNTIDKNITLGDYAAQWLDLYGKNKELYTVMQYKTVINHLELISNTRLCDLTRSHIQQIININSSHPSACKNIKKVTKLILDSAVIDGYLLENAPQKILKQLSMPAITKHSKEALTELERYALLNCDLPPQEKALLTLLYYTGIRKGESAALTVNDFDFENNTVSINKVIVWGNNQPVLKERPKSQNGVRIIPLCEPCICVLKDYVTNCADDIVFAKNGAYMTVTSYNTLWRHIINSASEYAGQKLDITPHRLRHNFCSLLCYQVPKISTKTIAKLLGDTETMVLQVYSHIMDDKEDIIGSLNSAFDIK